MITNTMVNVLKDAFPIIDFSGNTMNDIQEDTINEKPTLIRMSQNQCKSKMSKSGNKAKMKLEINARPKKGNCVIGEL